MRQKVGEGHLHRAAEIPDGAVKAATLHVGDPATRRVELDGQSVKASSGALDEMKVGIGRARPEKREQRDDRKEEPKYEDNRVAAARV